MVNLRFLHLKRPFAILQIRDLFPPEFAKERKGERNVLEFCSIAGMKRELIINPMKKNAILWSMALLLFGCNGGNNEGGTKNKEPILTNDSTYFYHSNTYTFKGIIDTISYYPSST